MKAYEKPELTGLGDATTLIQGSKSQSNDANVNLKQTTDCELED